MLRKNVTVPGEAPDLYLGFVELKLGLNSLEEKKQKQGRTQTKCSVVTAASHSYRVEHGRTLKPSGFKWILVQLS